VEEKQILLLPGPTTVPHRVAEASSRPMINHRGPEFKKIIFESNEKLKNVFQTKNDILMLTSSGTGGMEASVVNFLNKGEKVLVISVGAFGERFKEICRRQDLVVESIDVEWGKAVDPEEVKARLKADPEGEIKAVLLQHNETSTGVLNDLEAVCRAKGDHPALLIVDAVSSLVANEIKTDEWGIDVVVAASQKAFMMPPGLAMLAVSDRAWQKAESVSCSSLYFDLKMARKFFLEGQTPFTPAVSLFFALEEALKLLEEIGFNTVIRYHHLYRDMIRSAVRALGLELLTDDRDASNVVTTVVVPPYLKPSDITCRLREEFKIVIAGGQGKFKNTTFRIGHLGYVQPIDLIAAMVGLEMVLEENGFKVEIGASAKAMEKILKEAKQYV